MKAGSWVVVFAAAVGIFGCGGDSPSEPAGETDYAQERARLTKEKLGPLLSTVRPLRQAGFTVSTGHQIFACAVDHKAAGCNSKVIGYRLEAEKRDAEFQVAVFETAADAAEYGKSYVGPNSVAARNNFPAKLDGSSLYYSSKCCTGRKPRPVVPKDDYEKFVAITREAK